MASDVIFFIKDFVPTKEKLQSHTIPNSYLKHFGVEKGYLWQERGHVWYVLTPENGYEDLLLSLIHI